MMSLYLETEGLKEKFKFRKCNDDVDIRYDSAKQRLALAIKWYMNLHFRPIILDQSLMPGENPKGKQLHNLLYNYSWQNALLCNFYINTALRLEILFNLCLSLCQHGYMFLSIGQYAYFLSSYVQICVSPIDEV